MIKDLFAGRKKKAKKKSGSTLKYVVSTVLLVASILLCLIVTIQTLVSGYTTFFGYSVFRVVTGSMERTIPIGSVLLCKHTGIEDIKVEDIVCFKSRESSHYGSIVTHRVVSVQEGANGEIYLETRGDSNNSSDPYFVQDENLIGRVVWYSGKEGVFTKVLSFLTGKVGFLAIIVIPILVIVGLILQSAGKNIRGELDSTLEKLAKRQQNNKDNEPLPGYTTLTRRDYNEIYESLKRDLQKELGISVKGSEEKTEYSGKEGTKKL